MFGIPTCTPVTLRLAVCTDFLSLIFIFEINKLQKEKWLLGPLELQAPLIVHSLNVDEKGAKHQKHYTKWNVMNSG